MSLPGRPLCRCFLALALAATAAVRAGEFAVGTRDNIVVLGDSITSEGTYAQYIQDLIDEAYPDRLVRVIARGVHGDTARGAHARMELDVVRWRPDWVLLNFGINDVGRFSTEEFLVHYERLMNRVLRDTRARLMIVSPIYPDKDAENLKLSAFVDGLRALAAKYRAAYAPVYEETRRLRPALPAPIRYAVDGSHPNEIGHWIFSQTILAALDFPLPLRPRVVEIPARRVAVGQGDELAGTRFTLDLPTPLEVLLTAPPPPETRARPARGPIVIDGKLEDWDLAPVPLSLGAPAQRSWSVVGWRRDRHAARAWFCWDAEALYFAIQVEDSQVRRGSASADGVDRDCVELALDARTASERLSLPFVRLAKNRAYVAQYLLGPATSAGEEATAGVGLGDPAMAEGMTVASSPTSFGYQLEARIPAARFAAGKLAAGDRFPVDVTTVNLDRGDRYLDATSFRWTGSRWSAYNTREYGLLTMDE